MSNTPTRVALFLGVLLLVGNGCTKGAPPASTTPPPFEGDGIGSDRAGDTSLLIQSPLAGWSAYNKKLSDHDDTYALILRQPNGVEKTLAVGETVWPESFSLDGQLLLYVHNVRLSGARRATSLFVYMLATGGATKQVTNQEPDLATTSDDDFDKRYIATPLSGVTWSGHTITYITRGYKDAQDIITIDLDTGRLTRTSTSN